MLTNHTINIRTMSIRTMSIRTINIRTINIRTMNIHMKSIRMRTRVSQKVAAVMVMNNISQVGDQHPQTANSRLNQSLLAASSHNGALTRWTALWRKI